MEAVNDHMLQDNDRTTTTEALLKTCLTCSRIKNIKKQKQLMLKLFCTITCLHIYMKASHLFRNTCIYI